MGNASSLRSVSVVNDSLVPVVESSKAEPLKMSPEGEKKTSEDRTFVGEFRVTSEAELKAALDPFKKLSQQESSPDNMPEVQKALLECIKKNPGNSLMCINEIQNFQNYVNTVPATKSQR